MEINGKVIIVTGATGGIGSATARALAAGGAKVVLCATSAEKLKELEKGLPGSFAVPADVRKDEDVKRLVDATLEKHGRIDALVNGAGKAMWAQVEDIGVDEYRELFELNVVGYLRMMQGVIPTMRKQGGGSIVNISSMLTQSFYPNLAGYASTKYAVNSLSLSARAELEKDNIVVSVIRPKLVETDFGKNAGRPEPEFLRDRSNPKAPPMDTPDFVAQKILEILRTGQAEMDL